jgi:hypothetical protein
MNGGLGPLAGFARAADGTITPINDPETSTLFGTVPVSINAAGAITGYFYSSPPLRPHGFVRDPEGNFTTFDPAGSIFTTPQSINYAGAITGYYNEANQVIHGFLREADGTITSFNPRESTSTTALSINAAGAIAGYYQTADKNFHGFLRHPSGHITSFDPPGSVETYAVSINYSGSITGYYLAANGRGRSFGFVRDAAARRIRKHDRQRSR